MNDYFVVREQQGHKFYNQNCLHKLREIDLFQLFTYPAESALFSQCNSELPISIVI